MLKMASEKYLQVEKSFVIEHKNIIVIIIITRIIKNKSDYIVTGECKGNSSLSFLWSVVVGTPHLRASVGLETIYLLALDNQRHHQNSSIIYRCVCAREVCYQKHHQYSSIIYRCVCAREVCYKRHH